MPKPTVTLPIIVEGRYDKAVLSSLVNAKIFTTDGFSVFNSGEKQALFRKIAANGVILLTDSDGGGRQIRSFLSGILPKDKLFHLWIPEIPGKERRKRKAGKAGLLGVEGMEKETLLRVLAPFLTAEGEDRGNTADGIAVNPQPTDPITKADFFRDGLSGGENSSAKRDALARAFGLPGGMTANSLLAALNLTVTKEEYLSAVENLAKSGS